jgi:hypothetical protein
MKIRTNYVSNSSSSSFLVVYDENIFEEIIQELKKSYLGCSKIKEDLNDFFNNNCVEEELDNWKKRIQDYKDTGKKVVYMDLEYDYEFVKNILQIINDKSGGNKIEFIDGDVY